MCAAELPTSPTSSVASPSWRRAGLDGLLLLHPRHDPRELLGLLRDQDDLADVAPLGDEAVRVRRSIEWEGRGDNGPDLPRLEPRYQRLNHRSRLPSVSHQDSMLRPKTPLFSFITPRPFHHGIDENGLLASVLRAVGRLRVSPVCASDAPYMISRPPGRSNA
jgi:hypothetical protein